VVGGAPGVRGHLPGREWLEGLRVVRAIEHRLAEVEHLQIRGGLDRDFGTDAGGIADGDADARFPHDRTFRLKADATSTMVAAGAAAALGAAVAAAGRVRAAAVVGTAGVRDAFAVGQLVAQAALQASALPRQ